MSHCPHCGGELEPAKPSSRSVPQHRRYFAMIRAAYQHWPERHEFRPQSEEHLRKWLQAKAGHYTCRTIALGDMDHREVVAVVEAVMRAADAHAFAKGAEGKLYIFTPSSIAFEKLEHKAACTLFDEVAHVIEAETGTPAEKMMEAA